MRNLTLKQKNLLSKWYKEAEPTKEAKLLFNKDNTLCKFEDLTLEQIDILKDINDTEILYQNVNSFLWSIRNEY